MTKEEIFFNLLSLAVSLGRKLHKGDLGRRNGTPSHTACLSKGVSLLSVNNSYAKLIKTIPCKYCKQLMIPTLRDTKFCSQRCYGLSMIKEREPTRCALCEGEMPARRANNNSVCYTCELQSLHVERLNRWKNGEVIPRSPNSMRFLLSKDKDVPYECSVCKISTWNDKPITLEIDHVDGNPSDNSYTNVRLICPNCHSQTDTYKAKNYGNGRYKRKQRYQEGKSF